MLLMAVARFRGVASVAEKFQKISNFFVRTTFKILLEKSNYYFIYIAHFMG